MPIQIIRFKIKSVNFESKLSSLLGLRLGSIPLVHSARVSLAGSRLRVPIGLRVGLPKVRPYLGLKWA